MGMSDEAIMLKSIARSLKEIAVELEKLNERAEQEEIARFGRPDIPENCPKGRWTDPDIGDVACTACRMFWSCPYSSPAQDPKGGK